MANVGRSRRSAGNKGFLVSQLVWYLHGSLVMMKVNVSRAGMPAAELPPEIWQEIVDLVCDHGRDMHRMEVRETMCALQVTNRLLHDLCTPYLYRSVYILSEHSYRSYLASFRKTEDAPKSLPKHLMIPIRVDLGSPRNKIVPLDNREMLEVRRLCLLRQIVVYDYICLNLLEEFSGAHPVLVQTQFNLEMGPQGHDFANLRRLCLSRESIYLGLLASLRCPVLEDVVLLRPMIDGLDANVTAYDLREAVSERKVNPRFTMLNGLARTIDNPGFSRIQRSNSFFDEFSRLSWVAELDLFRVSADHEDDMDDYSSFMQFVEQSIMDGSLWHYCRQEGRRCGQESGLGLALVPY